MYIYRLWVPSQIPRSNSEFIEKGSRRKKRIYLRIWAFTHVYIVFDEEMQEKGKVKSTSGSSDVLHMPVSNLHWIETRNGFSVAFSHLFGVNCESDRSVKCSKHRWRSLNVPFEEWDNSISIRIIACAWAFVCFQKIAWRPFFVYTCTQIYVYT